MRTKVSKKWWFTWFASTCRSRKNKPAEKVWVTGFALSCRSRNSQAAYHHGIWQLITLVDSLWTVIQLHSAFFLNPFPICKLLNVYKAKQKWWVTWFASTCRTRKNKPAVKVCVKATIIRGVWYVNHMVPTLYLRRYYGWLHLSAGSRTVA